MKKFQSYLIMPLVTIYFSIWLPLMASAFIESSSDNIHITNKNPSIGEIISLIETQTKVSIYYNNTLVNTKKIINIKKGDYEIEELLHKIVENTGLEFIKGEGYYTIRIAKSSSKNITISGFIKDNLSGEVLPGASIYTTKNKTKGTTTDEKGFYSITLNIPDTVNLIYSYVGYKKVKKSILNSKNLEVNIQLENVSEIGEVVIIGNISDTYQTSTEVKSTVLNGSELKTLPLIGGEVNILNSLQFFPGVTASLGNNRGLNIRGGNQGHNLILLDGVPVYGLNHYQGVFSPFNASVIKKLSVYKSGIGVDHQGHLSATIDISMKDGNRERLHGSGAVGIVASNFTLEGPLSKNTSFIFSARKSYINNLSKVDLFSFSNDDLQYKFYDIHFKLTHWFSSTNKIHFNFYKGNDKFANPFVNNNPFREKQKFNFNNYSLGVKWSQMPNENALNNVWLSYRQFSYSDYSNATFYNIYRAIHTQSNVNTNSEFFIKWERETQINDKHTIKKGAQVIYHNLVPTMRESQLNNVNHNNLVSNKFKALESSFYISDNFIYNDKLQFHSGLRITSYLADNSHYFSIQPRVTSRYLINNIASLKMLYSFSRQNIHPSTNRTTVAPLNNWIPSSKEITPAHVHQLSMGTYFQLENGVQLSIETYFKRMGNLNFNNTFHPEFYHSNDWRKGNITGIGRSYGLEFFVKKKTDNFNVWVGYTLAKSERKYESLNEGKWFPFQYDRRHNFTLTLSKNWQNKKNNKRYLSLSWMLGGGTPFTAPTGVYPKLTPDTSDPKSLIRVYNKVNNRRLEPEHRLDFSFTFEKNKKWGQRKWIFGIYNIYYQRNPSSFKAAFKDYIVEYFDRTFLPILPTISYEFNF